MSDPAWGQPEQDDARAPTLGEWLELDEDPCADRPMAVYLTLAGGAEIQAHQQAEVTANWGNVEEISIHWPDGSHVVWVVEFESRVQRPPVPR